MQLSCIRLSDRAASCSPTARRFAPQCFRYSIQKLHDSECSIGFARHPRPKGSRVNVPHSPHFPSDSEPRSLRSAIVTRFMATTDLSVTPASRACPSQASRCGLAPRRPGLPMLTYRSFCTHVDAITPAAWLCAPVAHFQSQQRSSPNFSGLDAHIALFEACSTFTHVSTCVLADPALRDLFHQRLQPVPLPARVAPVASGWSNSCRVGYLPPTGVIRPWHGALKNAG